MKKIELLSVVLSFVVLSFCFVGCQKEAEDTFAAELTDASLVYEETVSPNKDYVSQESDIIYYTIQVYQNNNKEIIVTSSSNSRFYSKNQYKIDCDESITQDNIGIKWLTLGGSEQYSQNDEIALADVSITVSGKLLDERVTSFIGKAAESVADAVG